MPEAVLGHGDRKHETVSSSSSGYGKHKQLITESDLLEEMEAQGRKSEDGIIYNKDLVLWVGLIQRVLEMLEPLAGRFNISLSFNRILS